MILGLVRQRPKKCLRRIKGLGRKPAKPRKKPTKNPQKTAKTRKNPQKNAKTPQILKSRCF